MNKIQLISLLNCKNITILVKKKKKKNIYKWKILYYNITKDVEIS